MKNLNQFTEFTISNQTTQQTTGGLGRRNYSRMSYYASLYQQFLAQKNNPPTTSTPPISYLTEPQPQDNTETAYAVTDQFSTPLLAE